MSKRQLLYSVIIIIILCFVCSFIYDNFKVEEDSIKVKVIVSEIDQCSNNLKLYYTDSDDNNYYLYCLDQITIDFNDHKLPLNRALEAKQTTMDKFLYDYLPVTFEEYYKDGGSTHYYSDSMAAIKCNTVEGNKDYYFGPKNMQRMEGFCREQAYSISFSKYYMVMSIDDSDDKDYVNLVLKEADNDVVSTVKIEKNKVKDIISDYTYCFKFGLVKGSVDDSIEKIFDSNVLLSISDGRLID